ncbi:uncharacterized protein LOC110759710 [Prunus avium]|uniref:Uncharacterized protein LOC110759710 n=1 Tax=Prunus avium TaxID=42229 RepID=A0A6P5SN19_PRUAV|nr:uncharacterized protein LOC110759710 [Prunus avium]
MEGRNDLPEQVAHHIISFLTSTADLTSFGTVSRTPPSLISILESCPTFGLFKWISSHCRCIKELRLEHVGLADITIESSSLKSFSIVAGGDKLKISGEKLEDMHIRWRTNSSGQSLNIVAPSLTYLEWIGNTINHQLGKLLHLEKGEICLVADHNSFGKVFEVFRSGPMPLNDVSYLCITIGSFKDHLAPELANLFRRMPNLSTLRMKCNPLPESHGSGFGMEFWKMQNLAFISQLNEVTIELYELSQLKKIYLCYNTFSFCFSSATALMVLTTPSLQGERRSEEKFASATDHMAPSTPSLQGERGSEEKLSLIWCQCLILLLLVPVLLLLLPVLLSLVEDSVVVASTVFLPLPVCF